MKDISTTYTECYYSFISHQAKLLVYLDRASFPYTEVVYSLGM
jgi:hypothetical protein